MHGKHYLTPLFEPRSVAVIGATERQGRIGEVLVANMLAAGYRGRLFAINPKYRRVRGIKCYASVAALPEVVDLAVISTPAETVPGLVDECGRAGIRAVLVISAGFGETGSRGAALEAQVLQNARRHGVRMIGPNCLGILRPEIGLNAAFARGTVTPGGLGLVSQSGAVCTAMLDWATPNGIGFSSVISLGCSTDIDFGEIIDYLAADRRTEQILLYIEGVRDARRFMSSLRAAARTKPVILMKVGRHAAGSRAAVSHTGAIVGLDDVFDAAVRRAGVVRAHSVGELIAAALALASHIRPAGKRLAVITNGGGPGVMAADRATDLGLPLASLAPSTLEALRHALPKYWSHGNPIDLIGDADSARYRAAISACIADEGVDGVLVILVPQAVTDVEAVTQAVIDAVAGTGKPVIACWMGEASVAASRALLVKAGIPVFREPDPAVQMFAHLSSFYDNQRALMQVPGPLSEQDPADIDAASRIIAAALAEERTLLNEAESKQVLSAFRIPVAQAATTHSVEEALALAAGFGFPVALKIDSPDITHKSEVGGVRLDLISPQALREAYVSILSSVSLERPQARIKGVVVEPMVKKPNGRELFLGVTHDPVFGPAITLGPGGIAVEAPGDRSVSLPPLNAQLAADMIRDTRISRMFAASGRMPKADLKALIDTLLRISEMVCELPEIEELDVKPLIADEHGVVAVDARILLRRPQPAARRYAHLAIHPYPVKMAREVRLGDGTPLLVRPIRPEDAELELEFVRGLSETSRYLRFMNALRELSPAMLARFTQIDYDRDLAFIALPLGEAGPQVGVVRYISNPDGSSCEFAMAVADKWQGKGLGLILLNLLIEAARESSLDVMVGYVLAHNHKMLDVCARLGFVIADDPGDIGVKIVTLQVRPGV